MDQPAPTFTDQELRRLDFHRWRHRDNWRSGGGQQEWAELHRLWTLQSESAKVKVLMDEIFPYRKLLVGLD